jgi:hypothetical protein
VNAPSVVVTPDPRQRIAECVRETSLGFVAKCLDLPPDITLRLAGNDPTSPELTALARRRVDRLWGRARVGA